MSHDALSCAEVEALLRQHYGIVGRARQLSGEVDLTFHVGTADGSDVLLKIARTTEGADNARFQTQLLQHLEATDPELIVPRVLRTRAGASEIELAAGRSALLLSFLPGQLLRVATGSAVQRCRLGGWLARLGLALRDFSHPAEERLLHWDIAQASSLRGLLDALDDGERRAVATVRLDRFEEAVAPMLAGLRRQVVHNDLNTNNVLVDERCHDIITGIIDFGDALRTQLVNDVAIAAAYHLAEEAHPLSTVVELVAGYHAVVPLQPEEIRLIPDLMAMRFVMMVTISAWRARRQPDNRAYLLRNHERAWSWLTRLERLGETEAIDYLAERLR